jgi:hypothetical protein
MWGEIVIDFEFVLQGDEVCMVGQAWGSFSARRRVRRWIVEDCLVPIRGGLWGRYWRVILKLEVDT